MSFYEALRQHIPSLYRPEPGDRDLLSQYLQTTGTALDEVQSLATAVLSAHHFREADLARYHPHFVATRNQQGQSPLRPFAQIDLRDLSGFIEDLAQDRNLDQWLKNGLNEQQTEKIASFKTNSTDLELQRELSNHVDNLIKAGEIYDETRFTGIALDPELSAALQTEVSDSERVQRNRKLLEAAYPKRFQAAREDHEYIEDLARLAALIPLKPWTHPRSTRETAETFRLRISRMVDLYRNGLGTRNALRRVVEAQLPIARTRLREEWDRPFLLEENTPTGFKNQIIKPQGQTDDKIGPLMRWELASNKTVSPTIYIQGIAPIEGQTKATKNPMIERLGNPGLAIAYLGDLAPDETLCLQNQYTTWLALDSGLRRAPARTTQSQSPTPPWTTVNGAPPGSVRALYQTRDHFLWVALEDSTLWRFDGQTWLEMDQLNLPLINCMVESQNQFYLGTEQGLIQLEYWETPTATVLPQTQDKKIHQILPQDDQLTLGTNNGLYQWHQDSQLQKIGLDAAPENPVTALHEDKNGNLYVGSKTGLYCLQKNGGQWYYYKGEHRTDQIPDWEPYQIGEPLPQDSWLPEITAIKRGPDQSLWLGTTKGIARYTANNIRNASYETILEAFPEITTGIVTSIQCDDQGQMWFATERGLFRFDGRDWWQPRGNGWKQLGAAHHRYDAGQVKTRGAWRYNRQHQHWELETKKLWLPETPKLRTQNRTQVKALLFSRELVAQLGSWDGQSFTAQSTVAKNKLQMKYRPAPHELRPAGIPAVPELNQGKNLWRYLRHTPEEPAPPETKRPAWSAAGILYLPPESGEAPSPGRYGQAIQPEEGQLDLSVFAFDPEAKVTFTYPVDEPLTLVIRLLTYNDETTIEEAILDRVWEGIQLARPVGVHVYLAVNEEIKRGGQHGNPG